jgi:cyclic-di-AMP phosphodiesterase PgpH
MTSRIFRFRRRRIRLEREKSPMRPRTRLLLALLLGSSVLGASIFAFPLRFGFEPPDFEAGQIAGDEIIAPFSFDVPKPSEELDLERARAAQAVLPVFVPTGRGTAADAALTRLQHGIGKRARMTAIADTLGLGISTTTVRYLAVPDSGQIVLLEAQRLLAQARLQWLVGELDAELVKSYSRIQVNAPEGKTFLPSGQVYDPGRLADRALERGLDRLGPRGAEALVDLVHALAVPTLVYDRTATEAERQAARQEVSKVQTTILKGERIVDANERITPEQISVLRALRQALLQGVAVGGLRAWLFPLLGRILLVAVFLGLFALFVRIAQPAAWAEMGHLTLITVVTLIVLAVAGAIARSRFLDPLLTPIAFAAVVVTLLLGEWIALGLVVVLAVLIGSVSGWGLTVGLTGLVGGAIACYAVRHIVHRMEFIRSIIPIALGMMAVDLGIYLIGPGAPWGELAGQTGWLLANAVLSVVLASFLLPLFEKMFGLASNITLLELSDLNRPIFKRMMLEANGTYHHSMIVGSLSEAAAERVRANPLLARVGGYYHDIGKIAKSVYYGENLREGLRNPHEKLTPHMSSLILESHVREGLELARDVGLPRAVAAFIPEHQGTTLMQYFFNKAQELDPEVEERDYRYPGPRPQSKETAIVMLADAAEATVRSLDDPSPKRIRVALDRLIEARLADRQLDECGLTVADLARVREAFTHVLSGVLHSRVKYPWQTAGGERALGESHGTRVFRPELETGIVSIEVPGEFAGTSAGSGGFRRPPAVGH